jgi:2-keto-4-pentenoate hydratase/2-oxohepta-3-ene-1,7-dioic acid hydratase in catechol pathway
MKLFRFGDQGNEKPGIVLNDELLDASPFGEDWGEAFFESNGVERFADWLTINRAHLVKIPANARMAAPFTRPSKIICVGLNYLDHAKETGAQVPAEPIIFFKSTSALVGPNDNLVIPKNSVKTDWEVELAVIIGKRASYVSEEEALDYVAGYCIHNDYSERAFQLERGGQWTKGKGCDTFAPMGPYLVTKEEVKDVNALSLNLWVNGDQMQAGNTANMAFKVTHLVSYISQFMTLLPGDVVSTGTPAGVGMGLKPPYYLKAGDVVKLSIDGLGSQKQQVVNHL